MTDFQVGDRVSVEGVVTQALGTGAFVKIDYPQPIHHFFPADCLTLVERPRKKLRIGSVWYPPGHPDERYVVVAYHYDAEQFLEVNTGNVLPRMDLTFDGRTPWVEVTTEELERER